MTKDLHEPGDGAWQFAYPPEDHAIGYLEGRVYFPDANDLLVISYGNGLYLSLRAAQRFAKQTKRHVRLLDLRWLQPLNTAQIIAQAKGCKAILVVDEGRFSGGVGEGVITALVEGGINHKPIARVVGEDSYTALGTAAGAVIPSEDAILDAMLKLI
jgi:2-oxoisovalerate dehydrogenase E1 component